ncbi:MAG TPA: DUF5700 domain-containing putative Zn-dependent protease [Longimicrobiales bacterium]|nr:DUF5700 domain-containing putative Zn-dependent protease [Longimicrobiales bacterium]
MSVLRSVIAVALLASSCAVPRGATELPGTSDNVHSRVDVTIVTDEADAVVRILALRAAGRTPAAQDWDRLFQSEGYRRLQQRELAMQRPFEDTSFQAFALSDSLLLRADALRRTLDAWRRVDASSAAARAFRYLPQHAIVRARIYPVIKPRSNSFVFEPRTNPAIFLYLDPSLSSAQFENTLTHELHHIGIANACADTSTDTTVAPGIQSVIDWMGAFAEGRAMLAAAGAAGVHPHATSEAAERAVWERDLARAHDDMRRMEEFYFDLIEGRLTEEEAGARGFTFIATATVPQGAFYTLGWLMAATIETEFGRDRLVASTCDARMFIGDYQRAAIRRNRAAGDSRPLWSEELLRRIGVPDA